MDALLVLQQFCSASAQNQTHGFGPRNTVLILLNNLYWRRGVAKLPLKAFFKMYFSKNAEAPGMVIPG